MQNLSFKTFLEIADFGFDRQIKDPKESERPEKENPIIVFNIEYMRDILCEQPLGEQMPRSQFVNQIQWGEGVGSIRLWVDPKTGVYMDRLGTDLTGEQKWYTKKYFQINRHGYGGYEEVVSQELFDRLTEIHKMPPDSPKSDYKDLKTLLVSMVERLKKEAKPIFVFDRVTKMNENRYLIAFNLRGQGVQAPGQTRIEKLIVDLNYYVNEGYIRSIIYNYTSPLGGHKWEVSGPDIDLVAFPTQPRDEIISPIASNLRFY